MKTKLVAAALLAATAFVSAPVFASGFGPAPYYNPIAGEPWNTYEGGNTDFRHRLQAARKPVAGCELDHLHDRIGGVGVACGLEVRVLVL